MHNENCFLDTFRGHNIQSNEVNHSDEEEEDVVLQQIGNTDSDGDCDEVTATTI